MLLPVASEAIFVLDGDGIYLYDGCKRDGFYPAAEDKPSSIREMVKSNLVEFQYPRFLKPFATSCVPKSSKSNGISSIVLATEKT